jgi:deoxyhypusine synthase
MAKKTYPHDYFKEPVRAIEVGKKSVAELLDAMADTGFQGRKLGEAAKVWEAMINDPDVTILMGYAGSLSTTGQWKIVNWLIENRFIDVLVSTGANISEDIVDAMGYPYWKGDHRVNDVDLLKKNINRYYDVFGDDAEYLEMINLTGEFYLQAKTGYNYSSREFLFEFGKWLEAKGIHSIVATAAKHGVPVFSPALVDSTYGDGALIAAGKGHNVTIDQVKDFVEWMKIGEHVKKTGVIYIGGGVPKDFIQLLAVSSVLLYEDRKQGERGGGVYREQTGEYFYPHSYAIQITTDSPQWGGLSGCTFEEATSWGKESERGKNVACYCDATIALPLITHALADRGVKRAKPTDFSWLMEKK